jgi:hypothetical protein
MIILIKLFQNSKLDLIRTVKFVKQLFRIQIQKGGKLLLLNQVKSRMEACYSELVLTKRIIIWIKSNSNLTFRNKHQRVYPFLKKTFRTKHQRVYVERKGSRII